MIELAHQSHQDRIFYAVPMDGSGPRFYVDNKYVGGTTVLLYLTERLGENFHFDLHSNSIEKVVLELTGEPLSDTFQSLIEWFEGREEHQTYERLSASPLIASVIVNPSSLSRSSRSVAIGVHVVG